VEIHNKGGLSLGAKIGIGLSAGFGAIISIVLIACLFLFRRKEPRNRHVKSTSNTSDISAWVASTGASTAVPPVEGPVSAAMGPISNQTWAQKQGNIPGSGGEQMWTSSQPQYFRTPPPRTGLGPMRMPTGGQTIYSELPGATSEGPVEAVGEQTGWHGYHQQQTYGQAGVGYGQGGEADYITNAPPLDRAELGNSTPRPPWWRQ